MPFRARGGAAAAATPPVTLTPYLSATYARLGVWCEVRDDLYDVCRRQPLEWPSHCVEWLPDYKRAEGCVDFALHYLAVGTQAHAGAMNYVAVLETAVPENGDEVAEYFADDDADEVEAHDTHYMEVKGHSKVEFLLAVDGPVLALRGMPQMSDVLAVRTTASADVLVHRLDSRPKLSADPQDHKPDLVCGGLSTPGFALDWFGGSSDPGLLAAGSDDNAVGVWDVHGSLEEVTNYAEGARSAGLKRKAMKVAPKVVMMGHSDVIHAVSWHSSQSEMLVSASQDTHCMLWDTRIDSPAKVFRSAHAGGALSVHFHPTAAHQFASCGADAAVKFWDLRMERETEQTLVYHSAAVTNVRWSPFSDTVLATASIDQTLCLWDFARGSFPTVEESKDAPPTAPSELVFCHPGHIGRITDLQWCPNVGDDWLIASVDACNSLHVVKPRREVVEDRVDVDPFDQDIAEED